MRIAVKNNMSTENMIKVIRYNSLNLIVNMSFCYFPHVLITGLEKRLSKPSDTT